jgi:hypothetical protein
MNDLSPEDTRRWNAWRQANLLSARAADRVARVIGTLLVTGGVLATVMAILAR